MTFQKPEIEQLETVLAAYLERERPPESVRAKLDYSFLISDRSVELNEIRPRWNDPNQSMVNPFAKATYVTTQNIWQVYWRRADEKWHRYAPTPSVATLEEFLALVKADTHACFHG